MIFIENAFHLKRYSKENFKFARLAIAKKNLERYYRIKVFYRLRINLWENIKGLNFMYLTIKAISVLVSILFAFAYFVWRSRVLVQLMNSTQKTGPKIETLVPRLIAVFKDVLMQSRVRRKRVPGTAHAMIFWGFIVITVGTVEMMVEGVFHEINLAFISPTLNHWYQWFADIMLLAVLLGVFYGFFRRLILKPKYLVTGADALMILAITAGLMLSLFAMNTFKIATDPISLFGVYPLSSKLYSLFGFYDLSTENAFIGTEIFYWVHLLMVLGFLMYIPHSKHLHILAAGPNIFFKHLGTPKALEKTNLEDENATSFGLGKISDISWKTSLDLYACTECGRCQEVCPADLTGKPLSPSRLIHDFKEELFLQKDLLLQKKYDDIPSVIREGSAVTEDVIWSCTSCRACEEVCPVNIEQTNLIFESRKNLVLMESKFPAELQTVFRNMENNFTPWAFGSDTRADWCKGLGVKEMADHPKAEVLYYVGCAGSFDDRAKKVATAIVKLLQKANVDFAILGKEEKCNGDPARRAGNEYLAQMLIQENVAILNKYKPRKILTGCPHCFNTLKNEYPQFGAQYEVVHHTTFLADLLREGKLKPHKNFQQEVTFHDSCYLGRWNDIYSDPRAVLEAIPELKVTEMPRNKNKGLCCGAGGARMFMEETIGKRINIERTEEAIGTNAKVIASGCPFCSTMLTDGVKAKEKQDTVTVKDIAEILEESLT
ncbi:MAG: heterodisulfide reductase-related iron-sulfur binding cluster [Oligoflexia bacterium]|nr:heterodisulfide reductase-related iron-sulfur binding cluster [Oligoflexia bacterium]